jgi:hypothetical protein
VNWYKGATPLGALSAADRSGRHHAHGPEFWSFVKVFQWLGPKPSAGPKFPKVSRSISAGIFAKILTIDRCDASPVAIELPPGGSCAFLGCVYWPTFTRLFRSIDAEPANAFAGNSVGSVDSVEAVDFKALPSTWGTQS